MEGQDCDKDEEEKLKVIVNGGGGKFPGLTQTNFTSIKDRKMTDFDIQIDESKKVTFENDEKGVESAAAEQQSESDNQIIQNKEKPTVQVPLPFQQLAAEEDDLQIKQQHSTNLGFYDRKNSLLAMGSPLRKKGKLQRSESMVDAP